MISSPETIGLRKESKIQGDHNEMKGYEHEGNKSSARMMEATKGDGEDKS